MLGFCWILYAYIELLSCSWSAKALHDHLQTFLEQVLFYKRRSSIDIHRTTLDFEWLWYCGRSNRLGVCDEIARLSNLRDWPCQSVSQAFSATSYLHLDAMSGSWPESKDALGIPTARTTWTNSRGLETLHKYMEQHHDILAFHHLSQKNNSWQDKKREQISVYGRTIYLRAKINPKK